MSLVQLDRQGEVLVMTLAHPPINALSAEVRSALVAALEELAQDKRLRAGLIMGAGPTFIAGADIREFSRPPSEPQLPQLIAAIDSLPKPVVAALNGATLGAGLELALACDLRLAAPGISIGLPEVKLGILPGAGGTQRLPRLVGLAQSIEMIGTGRPVRAEAALAMGLIDQIEAGDLRAAAVLAARSLGAQPLAQRKRRVSERTVPPGNPQEVEQAEQAALRAGKRRPAVVAALACVRHAQTLPLADGLAIERAHFLALRASPEAAAMRHLFFAERQAGRLSPAERAAPRHLERVAVVGAGTMGVGIAIALLESGLRVTLLDLDAASADRARTRIEAHFANRVQSGRLSVDRAAAHRAHLVATAETAAISGADLVIEAVFEEISVKAEVFRQIDAHARPGAVLATNTSYLDVDQIAGFTRRPQDLIGLHFFSPANVMSLLEVVRGQASAPDAVATGLQLAKRLGKTAVLCGNAFGFIGNRIYNAYRRECEFMLEDGAWPEEIDRALEDFGMAMGPFAVADLSGLDIAWRMRQAQAATRDPRTRYVDVLDRLCEAGRLGRKAGAGYYRYEDGHRSGGTDAQVRALIEEASTRRGLNRRSLSPQEIQTRALLAMVNEAAHLLAQGVASQASDVDVVMAHGYGFPRWEGGPVHWARRQDRTTLTADLQALVTRGGHGFSLAPLGALLDEAL